MCCQCRIWLWVCAEQHFHEAEITIQSLQWFDNSTERVLPKHYSRCTFSKLFEVIPFLKLFLISVSTNKFLSSSSSSLLFSSLPFSLLRKYNIRVEDIMVRDVRYITLNCCYRDLHNVLLTGHLKTLALVESAGETQTNIMYRGRSIPNYLLKKNKLREIRNSNSRSLFVLY